MPDIDLQVEECVKEKSSNAKEKISKK